MFLVFLGPSNVTTEPRRIVATRRRLQLRLDVTPDQRFSLIVYGVQEEEHQQATTNTVSPKVKRYACSHAPIVPIVETDIVARRQE